MNIQTKYYLLIAPKIHNINRKEGSLDSAHKAFTPQSVPKSLTFNVIIHLLKTMPHMLNLKLNGSGFIFYLKYLKESPLFL